MEPETPPDRPGRADHLAKHRFQKGQSGNPGGRPKGKSFRSALTKIITEKHNGRSRLELLAEVLLREAFKGKPAAIKELLDRLEGRAGDERETDDDKKVVVFNIVEAKPPPGWGLPEGG